MEKQRALVVATTFDEIMSTWKTIDGEQYAKEGHTVTWPSDLVDSDSFNQMVWNRSDHDYGREMNKLFGLIVFVNCNLALGLIDSLAAQGIKVEVKSDIEKQEV